MTFFELRSLTEFLLMETFLCVRVAQCYPLDRDSFLPCWWPPHHPLPICELMRLPSSAQISEMAE